VINFRFHLISLIAVFLALAVGVIMGYAVLGQPTVDTLQSRVDTVEARANEIRSENDRLRSEQARLEGLLEDLDQYAATSRLREASVLPVAVRGVDGGRVGELVELVRDAGGTAPGIVWLEGKWNLEGDDDAAELATIVGSTSASKAAIREDAARVLTNRFLVGPPSGRPDPLIELDDAGFISFQEIGDTPFDPARLDARSSRLVVIGGNGADVPFERAALPLATTYAELGRLVAVVDEWTENDQGRRAARSWVPSATPTCVTRSPRPTTSTPSTGRSSPC
jgi:hypothetical protein